MEKIILGFLMLKQMTLYEMRGFIQKNLKGICSDSIGSMQAALKKLMEKGEISFQEFVEHGVNKKLYSITDKGMEAFSSWISVPIDSSKAKNMEEGKLFFLGIAGKEVRLKVLTEYLENTKSEYKYLLEIKQTAAQTTGQALSFYSAIIEQDEHREKVLKKVSGDSQTDSIVKNIFYYQTQILELAIRKCEFNREWVQRLIDEENKND